MMNRIVIFGAASGGLAAYSLIQKTNNSILCFADNDTQKRGLMLAGIPIKIPAEIDWSEVDWVLIATNQFREVFEQLVEKSAVPVEKILLMFSACAAFTRELCLNERLHQAEQLARGADRFVGFGEASAFLIRAEIAFFKQDWLSSSLFFDKAHSLSNENFSVSTYARFGQACRKAMRLDQAEEIIRKGLSINPDYKWLYLEYAELEMARENWSQAIGHFETIMKFSIDDLPDRFFVYLSRSYAQILNFDRALEVVNQGLKRNPTNVWLQIQSAVVNKAHKELQPVMDSVEKQITSQEMFRAVGIAEFWKEVSKVLTIKQKPTHTAFKKLSQLDKFTDDQGRLHLVYKPYDHFVWGNDDWRTSQLVSEHDRIQRKIDHDRKNVGYFSDILKLTGHHLEGSHVLEIGCGDGLRSYILCRTGLRHICSIDPDIDDTLMMKSLHAYASIEGINPNMILDKITIQQKGIEEMSDQNQYDLIISWYVFEHVSDPKKAFEKIANALKPGGLAYFVVNPFFSISGGHMRGPYNFPFSHVLLDDLSYRRFLGQFYSDMACEKYFERHTLGLNRMTIEDFRCFANEVGFKSELFVTTPSSQAKSVLTPEYVSLCRDRYPRLLVQDLLCNVLTALFIKPNHTDEKGVN